MDPAMLSWSEPEVLVLEVAPTSFDAHLVDQRQGETLNTEMHVFVLEVINSADDPMYIARYVCCMAAYVACHIGMQF